MKNKQCFKAFVRYSSLNILGMIGLSGYILADTFFVAKGLGASGLAALNIALPIYSFVKGSGLLFGMGGATKYMIQKSQGENLKANQIFTQVMLMTLCVSIGFFTIGLFLSGQIATLLGADEMVLDMCRTYLQVTLLFAPLYMLNNGLLCFIRNDGAPQLSMYAMLVGSLSNIVLDYIFIFPFKMGMFGAAFATGLAPAISIVILVPFFLK
ncbi:MAG: MATE family efflux transporter, partial [Eubacterium sp.]